MAAPGVEPCRAVDIPLPNSGCDPQNGARVRTWRAVVNLRRLCVEGATAVGSAAAGTHQLRGRPRSLTGEHGRFSLSESRQQRSRRRASAMQRLTTGRAPSTWWRPHAVYLIHIEDQQRFKVGIGSRSGLRLQQFGRWVASVTGVDHLVVCSRGLAEIIELEVLATVEAWHVLGNRGGQGGGYTEMWSDRGPSVDLSAFASHVAAVVAGGA